MASERRARSVRAAGGRPKSGGRNHRYSASYCSSTNRPNRVLAGEVREVDASRDTAITVDCLQTPKGSIDGCVFETPSYRRKKKGRRGFSWTTLLFGFWPALFRGDAKWAIVQFALGLSGFLTFGISSLISCIVFGFKYNELHLNDLREKGYVEITQAEYFALYVPTVVAATR